MNLPGESGSEAAGYKSLADFFLAVTLRTWTRDASEQKLLSSRRELVSIRSKAQSLNICQSSTR